MAFLKVNKEDVAAQGASSYIKTSGIYDLTLKAVEVSNTKGGATQVNYFADNINAFGQIVASKEGKNTDKNGKKLSGYGVLEALAVVLNTVDEDGETGFCDPEEVTVKFSKGPKELICLDQATDAEVKAWVQFEYQEYNGKIQERINIKRFYRKSDGASGSEISAAVIAEANGTKVPANLLIGTQIGKDENYATETKYAEGVTEGDVERWKDANSGAAKSTSTPATGAAKKPNPFKK